MSINRVKSDQAVWVAISRFRSLAAVLLSVVVLLVPGRVGHAQVQTRGLPGEWYGVEVTPDGGTAPERTAHTGGYSASFLVENTGNQTLHLDIQCWGSANVTCTGTSRTSLTLQPEQSRGVTAYYDVGESGNGTLTLEASTDEGPTDDQGYYNVPVVSPPPYVHIESPAATVYTGYPVLRARYYDDEVVDTTETKIWWAGDRVEDRFRMAQDTGGVAEWEVEPGYGLARGDSALFKVEVCDNIDQCTADSLMVTFEAGYAPELDIRHRPLADHTALAANGLMGGISTSDGYVETGIGTPAYRSLDVARAVGLVYSTRQGNPQWFGSLQVELHGSAASMDVSLWEGALQLASATYSTANCDSGCQVGLQEPETGTAPANNVELVEGTLVVEVVENQTPYSADIAFEMPLVDRRDSPYGAGWWVAGLQTLTEVTAGGTWSCDGENANAAVIAHANGTVEIFRKCGGQYIAPPGDRSELSDYGNGWRRTWPDSSYAEFDSSGRLVKSHNPAGREVTYSYNDYGISQITDPVDSTFTFGYDGNGKLSYIEGPAGRRTYIEIDTSNLLAEVRGPDDSLVAEFGYDTLNAQYKRYELLWVENALGHRSTVIYNDTIDRVLGVDGPTPTQGEQPKVRIYPAEIAGLAESGSGHAAVALPDVRTELESQYYNYGASEVQWRSSYVWRDRWGNATKTEDPEGNTTTAAYDLEGKITQAVNVFGDTTSFGYDSLGYPLWVRDHRYNVVDSTSYDARGRLVWTKDRDGGVVVREYEDSTNWLLRVIDQREGTDTTRFEYNGKGQVTRQWVPDIENAVVFMRDTATGDWWNTKKVVRPSGDPSPLSDFDSYGRAWRTRITYNTGTATVTDTVTRHLDLYNQVDSVQATLAGWTRYYRNELGQVDSARAAMGAVTSFIYDELGRVRRKSYPDGTTDSLAYDVAGNLEYLRTRRGHVFTYEYDIMDRMTERVVPDEGSYYYRYNAYGQMDTLDSPLDSADVFYEYDGDGRLVTETALGIALRFAYDDFDRLDTLYYPNPGGGGETYTRYYYDSRHRLWQIENAYSGDTIQYEFFGHGGAKERNLLWGGGAGEGDFKHIYWRDADANLDRLEYGWKHTEYEADRRKFGRRAYDWNDLHQAIRDTLFYPDASDTLRHYYDRTIEYDALGRVTREDFNPDGMYGPPDSLAPALDRSWTYDLMGNRYSMGSPEEVYDTITGRLLSDATWDSLRYDDAGNLIEKSKTGETWEYVYNAQNQLTQVKLNGSPVAALEYDGLGRLMKTSGDSVPSLRYRWWGGHVLFDLKVPSGSIETHYTWGPGSDNLLVVHTGGNSYYPAQDQQGTVSALMSRDTAYVAKFTYGVWGEMWAEEGESAVYDKVRHRYTGRAWYAGIGLYYYRARWYDPKQGRFTQEDPAGGGNPYAYASGDPMNLVDPSGAKSTLPPGDYWVAPQCWDSRCLATIGWRPWWELTGSEWIALQEAIFDARTALENLTYEEYEDARKARTLSIRLGPRASGLKFQFDKLSPGDFQKIKDIVLHDPLFRWQGEYALKGLGYLYELLAGGMISWMNDSKETPKKHGALFGERSRSGDIFISELSFASGDLILVSRLAHEIGHMHLDTELGYDFGDYPDALADTWGRRFMGPRYHCWNASACQ